MPENTRFSLLDEPLLSVKLRSGDTDKLNLPEVLAGLIEGSVVAFTALQPHQWQSWYSFLVQLATMAIARENNGEIPTSTTQWRKLVVALAAGSEEAFCLVVDDLSKPAFFQSPIPEGSLKKAKYKSDTEFPDLLDMLVTSKNHDIKRARIRHPDIEHWIYALITLQTLQGYLGTGNYGIARMNGGHSARPLIGFSPSLELAGRFLRDIQCLLCTRQRVIDDHNYDPQGHALLWLHPWDGSKKSGYLLENLDPYFLEICRRIRFSNQRKLICWRSGSQGYRITKPNKFTGITGDPWTPINREGEKAMSVVASGFPYARVRDLLLGEKFAQPAALMIEEGARGGFFIAIGLARGEGKTDGFHRRIVSIPANITSSLLGADTRQHLAQLSKARIERAGRVQAHVLRPALYRLVGDGAEYDDIRRWDDLFSADVDDEFFPALWRDADLDEQRAKENWQRYLKKVAQALLEAAIDAAPKSAARRYRIIAEAESLFINLAYKEIPLAMTRTSAHTTDTNALNKEEIHEGVQ